MNKQAQEAREGAVAVQGGRDVTINQGVSPEQMKEIMTAIAVHVREMVVYGQEIAEKRLRDLEAKVLERFASDAAARPDAFKDPDFQHMLSKAQNAYARSGDEGLRDTLVDLIARRSKETERNRLALSLNEAVETSAVLTQNEFAELAIVYLLKYTRRPNIKDFATFRSYLQQFLPMLVPQISEEQSSYTYMEAQGCASIMQFVNADLRMLLVPNYAGVLSNGFDEEKLKSHLPDGKKDIFQRTNIVIPCMHDNTKLQFNALAHDDFFAKTKGFDLTEPERQNLWNMFGGTVWNKEEIIANLPDVPELGTLFGYWSKTPLGKLNLTSVGIAIGHAYLVHIADFDADLSIWIK